MAAMTWKEFVLRYKISTGFVTVIRNIPVGTLGYQPGTRELRLGRIRNVHLTEGEDYPGVTLDIEWLARRDPVGEWEQPRYRSWGSISGSLEGKVEEAGKGRWDAEEKLLRGEEGPPTVATILLLSEDDHQFDDLLALAKQEEEDSSI